MMTKHQLFFLVGVILLLCKITNAREFQIDLTTGSLIEVTSNMNARTTKDQQTALWPQFIDNSLSCSTSFDAELSPLDGSYQINFWYFKERLTSSNSAYAIVVHISDLETFVANSFNEGIWNNPLDCEAIFASIWQTYKTVIKPTGLNMVSHLNGMTYSVQCVQWTNDEIDIINDLYHVCTTDELKAMLDSSNFQTTDISFSSF
jgi:hypothetical protein